MAMHVSARGIAFVMLQEGFSPVVYQDVSGHATIGFGHKVLGNEKFNSEITKAQAQSLLVKDMVPVEYAIVSLVTATLTQSQFNALASFIYNVGVSAFAGSTLLRHLNAGDYNAAADEFLRWNKVIVSGALAESPGLTARRAAERSLFQNDSAV